MNHRAPPDRTPRWAVDTASACTWLGTWGQEPQLRADLLAERAADLTDQLADPTRNSPGAIAGRAFRTLGGDVKRRVTSQHVSALPLAFSLLIAGCGSLLYATLVVDPIYRLSLVLEGMGFLVLALTGMRSPLAIRRVPSAFGSLILAAGTALGVVAIPFDQETSLFVITAKTSLVLATLGFAALAAGLLTGWDKAPRMPGAIILLAAGLIVFSEIGWALYVLDKDALQLLAAGLTATGGVLFFRFFGRLRHLPVEPTTTGGTAVAS